MTHIAITANNAQIYRVESGEVYLADDDIDFDGIESVCVLANNPEQALSFANAYDAGKLQVTHVQYNDRTIAAVIGHSLTDAERFASELGDDGTRWRTSDGRSFAALLRAYDATTEHMSHDRVRYVFADGSAVVECGDCWRVE